MAQDYLFAEARKMLASSLVPGPDSPGPEQISERIRSGSKLLAPIGSQLRQETVSSHYHPDRECPAILHFTRSLATPEYAVKVVALSGRQRASARLASGMNQMDTQETSYLSIEVNPATLDTEPEQRALTHRDNGSC